MQKTLQRHSEFNVPKDDFPLYPQVCPCVLELMVPTAILYFMPWKFSAAVNCGAPGRQNRDDVQCLGPWWLFLG